MKYWTSGNQIILITADKLLFGNHSKEKIEEFVTQVNNGLVPNQLTGIPISYIKNIQLDDRKKKIEIELGKGSIEEISFKSKQLRNTVFDYLKDNFKIFSLTRPPSTKIWKRYGMTIITIVFFITLLLIGGQFIGYSLGAKAIATFMTWLMKTFDKTVILLVGLSLIVWRTIILVLDLKALKKTLRLTRR